MSSFLFEGAFTRLASLDAADYSNLRIALVESAPTVTDEFAADLDETAAANYARKTPTGGALTQTAGKTLVTGTIPTWSALGTAETLTHWVLLYNTGSDATSWLIAAVALGHTCDGGDLTISTSGFLVDPTITRALGGTAADITYDDTGNAILTPAATVQAALDGTDFLLANFAFPSFQDLRYIEAYTGSGTYTVTGDKNTVTLDLTGDLEVTLPTPASSGRTLWLIVNASAADRALSFATTIDWLGDAPATIPSETGRLILLKWGGGPEGSGSGWWGVDFWQLVSGGGGLSAPVALSDLATQANLTLVGNNSGGTAAPTALTASAVRTLLALGGAAVLNVGTTAGTVAAGDDSRITGAAQVANNLSDVTAATARTNLAVPGTTTLSTGTIGQSYLYDGSNVVAGYPAAARQAFFRPTGTLAETVERTNISATGFGASSGRVYAAAVPLLKGQTVTTITFFAVAAVNTPSNQWFGLYDSSGNKLAVTNDDTTTAWAANAAKPLNLTSPYSITSSGLYYLVICQVASMPATLVQSDVLAPASAVASLAPILGGRDSATGYTNPASAPATLNLTANLGQVLYAHAS